MSDPLVAALAAVMEEALARGLVVQPVGDAWLVKLAPSEAERERLQEWYEGTSTSPEQQVRRTW